MSRSIEDQLLDPRPGSAAAAARDFGIDLTLLIRRLKLTPQERLDELQRAMRGLEELRKSAAPQLRKRS
ncbi:MAG TPA: hypothetical protein VF634_12585 [Pyrinomonadaceae bacterium]